MPELPEVERVRRSLERAIVGRRITDVRVVRRDVVATAEDPAGGFARSRNGARDRARRVAKGDLLAGDRIVEVRRLGKQLAVMGESGRAVNIHLGMTGQVLCLRAGERLEQCDHVHVQWRLEDGGRMVFRDPRRFGGIWTCASEEDLLMRRWGLLGPDGASIGDAELAGRLSRTKRCLKAALLDQHLIAGVGNIYADEALFRAGLSPHRPACQTTAGEGALLAEAIRGVLAEAIEAGGTTLRDYRDADGVAGGYQLEHRVYGRGGEACWVCGTILSTEVLAGRTTVWCSVCQS